MFICVITVIFTLALNPRRQSDGQRACCEGGESFPSRDDKNPHVAFRPVKSLRFPMLSNCHKLLSR